MLNLKKIPYGLVIIYTTVALIGIGTFVVVIAKDNTISPKDILSAIVKNKIGVSKEDSLYKTYAEIIELNKKSDYRGLYEYLRPEDKDSISINEFIKKNTTEKPPVSIDYQVHNVEFRNDVAYIDRTVRICDSVACQGEDRFVYRDYKKMYYINGKWYTSIENSTTCNRDKMYNIPTEFKRALDLIIQREEKGINESNKNFAQNLKEIQNCLDIQYASSDVEMQGAEGYFQFDKNSSLNDLKIIISPKYQVKDDLLTSTLLVHEITHAMFFNRSISFPESIPYSCFENEAHAFTNEYAFVLLLNQEEKLSLYGRFATRTSDDVFNTMYTLFQSIGNMLDPNSDSVDYYQKALNYVKRDPYYQKQCNK